MCACVLRLLLIGVGVFVVLAGGVVAIDWCFKAVIYTYIFLCHDLCYKLVTMSRH